MIRFQWKKSDTVREKNKKKTKKKKNVITVKGHDSINTGNFARKIRCFRKPDAYKDRYKMW